ncbi:Prolactin, partial [Chelonia mydas]
SASVAICARQGDSGCRFLSVSDLFDRVIQHSDRLHSLSTALYLDLEKNFLPSGNELGKWTGKCHTSRMLTPNGKEYVQKIPMQSMGIISNSLNGMGSSEAAGLSISNEANLMSDYEFIHCFRRDSNKVQSYLKILKCRIWPGNSC